MKRKLVLLIVLVLLVACGGESGGGESNLERALALLPADATEVFFTDWALIKEYEGATDISSKSSMDERMEFLRFGSKIDPEDPKPMRQAVASAYGLSRFQFHAETWSWDSTDLVWEASTAAQGPPLYVLQFPDDFDFDPLLALFDEREFTTSEYRGVTIYSHEMDLKTEWLRTTEFSILNTAVLPEEKQLVLSAGIESVQFVLDVVKGEAESLADVAGAQATVERLGEIAAAYVGSGPDVCLGSGEEFLRSMVGSDVSEETLEELKERLAAPEDLHLYTAMGVGYRYEEDRPVGLIVMHYPDVGDAEADLEPRRQMAQEGFSFRFNLPYSEVLFTVEEASVEDSDLVLQVRPVNDMPRRLIEIVFSRDMAFAVCP